MSVLYEKHSIFPLFSGKIEEFLKIYIARSSDLLGKSLQKVMVNRTIKWVNNKSYISALFFLFACLFFHFPSCFKKVCKTQRPIFLACNVIIKRL